MPSRMEINRGDIDPVTIKWIDETIGKEMGTNIRDKDGKIIIESPMDYEELRRIIDGAQRELYLRFKQCMT